MMLQLILLLLAGGIVAWQCERINPDLPRWISIATIS